MLKELLGPDIQQAIQGKDCNGLKDGISDWEATEIADLLMSLPLDHRPVFFRILPRRRAAEVFTYLPTEDQERLLQSLATENVRALLDELAPDDRTMFFEELPAPVTQRLLNLLSPAELT